MENGPLSGAQHAFTAVSLLPPAEVSSITLRLPPTSQLGAGTFQRSRELNQNYTSLPVAWTSETVPSRGLLEAQGARGGLIIITLGIHRPLFSMKLPQTLSCSACTINW